MSAVERWDQRCRELVRGTINQRGRTSIAELRRRHRLTRVEVERAAGAEGFVLTRDFYGRPAIEPAGRTEIVFHGTSLDAYRRIGACGALRCGNGVGKLADDGKAYFDRTVVGALVYAAFTHRYREQGGLTRALWTGLPVHIRCQRPAVLLALTHAPGEYDWHVDHRYDEELYLLTDVPASRLTLVSYLRKGRDTFTEARRLAPAPHPAEAAA